MAQPPQRVRRSAAAHAGPAAALVVVGVAGLSLPSAAADLPARASAPSQAEQIERVEQVDGAAPHGSAADTAQAAHLAQAALRQRIADVRAALARPAAQTPAPAWTGLVAQATEWTNWPKWSKWSNWANK